MSVFEKYRWQIKKEKRRFNELSLIQKLRKEGKSSEEFEIMVNALELEELIGLKLELASRSIGGKFFGFQIWHNLPEIVRDAILKFVYSTFRTQAEAAAFLGVRPYMLYRYTKKYQISDYFEKEEKNY
jgi:hypothetical protein